MHDGNIGSHAIDNKGANFLFGPRISFRYPRIRPYLQVLWGGVYLAYLLFLISKPAPRGHCKGRLGRDNSGSHRSPRSSAVLCRGMKIGCEIAFDRLEKREPR